MARDDDDDDSLPPLGENTDRFLEQAKKGQARNFLLVCKGNKVTYLAVRKKPIKKNELIEAKKAGYKGDGYFGVITGKGMELVFNLSMADGYTSEPVKDKILKDFLEEKAEFKCKPTIAIVAELPAIPFDEDDLKNPLVARFLALDVKISDVLDANPSAESELAKTTTTIRLLLQDAEFGTAEPLVGALEARLQELLGGAPAVASPATNVPQPQTSTSQAAQPASPTTATTTATPTVDSEALKLKLQEALNKLVQQLKQAVVTYPEKKVELLTPVAQIKKQMDSGDLQEAKKGILAVGQLLKSVMAQATTQNGNEPQTQSANPLLAEYDRKLAELQPSYSKAIREMIGDTSKFRTVMAYITEQANALAYGNAIKAIDRLTQAIATAMAAGVKETDVIPENIVADRKKFVQSRWQEAIRASYAEIEKLASPIDSQVPEENSRELVSSITEHLNQFVDELNNAILGTDAATSQDQKPIESALKAIRSYRSKIAADPLFAHLAQAKAKLGVDVQVSQKLLAAIDDLEARLAG